MRDRGVGARIHPALKDAIKSIQDEHRRIGREMYFTTASRILAEDYRDMQEKITRGIALTRRGKF